MVMPARAADAQGHQWVTTAGVRRGGSSHAAACRELTGLYEWRRCDWLSPVITIKRSAALKDIYGINIRWAISYLYLLSYLSIR
jgi:hypothetical protein